MGSGYEFGLGYRLGPGRPEILLVWVLLRVGFLNFSGDPTRSRAQPPKNPTHARVGFLTRKVDPTQPFPRRICQ